jgi:phenylalanyl-tRNA synthetase alpha chain
VPTRVLTPSELRRDLAVPDLTDPAGGLHAVQLVVGAAVRDLRTAWGCPVRVLRGHPVVAVADNYDVLGFTPSAVARDVRHTRYVTPATVLRTHTSALIPAELRRLADEATATAPPDLLLAAPGIVYRRDCVDRWHAPTPHQLDLWRVRGVGAAAGVRGPRCSVADLEAMVALVVGAVLPGHPHRLVPSSHPYTVHGRQIDVAVDDGAGGTQWVEVGECGLAHPEVLGRCGLDPVLVSGLAMGLGLDRIVMLRKGMADIRLLRAGDERVVAQLGDLLPYRPVSACPAIVRDLSIAVGAGVTAEDLGDRVREALAADADKVESVTIVSETGYDDLPDAARRRLGLGPGQRNLLVRVVLCRLDRALVRSEANALRDAIYRGLHEGRPVADVAGEEAGDDAGRAWT